MRIDVNGSRLYFDIEGVGYDIDGSSAEQRPTLILLHGSPGTSDHTVFKPVFRELTDVAQIVYLDLLGPGAATMLPTGSTASNDGPTTSPRSVVNSRSSSRPCSGTPRAEWSRRCTASGIPTIRASWCCRARRAGSIHDDVSTCSTGSVVIRLAMPPAKALVDVGDMAAFADYARTCMPLYNPTPREAPRHTIFRRSRAHVAFHELGGIWHTMDFLDDLSAIRCPTLVFAGADDPVTPIEDSEDIVARLDPALARFERFERAGHGVWIDDPVRAFSVLRDFMLSS